VDRDRGVISLGGLGVYMVIKSTLKAQRREAFLKELNAGSSVEEKTSQQRS
jgi:hypothetical protein